MEINQSFWKNQHVIVTGHTIFKVSYLIFFLYYLKAKIIGISICSPMISSVFKKESVGFYYTDYGVDIRNENEISEKVQELEIDPYSASQFYDEHVSKRNRFSLFVSSDSTKEKEISSYSFLFPVEEGITLGIQWYLDILAGKRGDPAYFQDIKSIERIFV
jgi:hypothetical protein